MGAEWACPLLVDYAHRAKRGQRSSAIGSRLDERPSYTGLALIAHACCNFFGDLYRSPGTSTTTARMIRCQRHLCCDVWLVPPVQAHKYGRQSLYAEKRRPDQEVVAAALDPGRGSTDVAVRVRPGGARKGIPQFDQVMGMQSTETDARAVE